MKRQLLIFGLLIGLCGIIYSCKLNKKTNASNKETGVNTNNQEINKEKMETKYQAVWEKALAGRDLKTIDSLISQNRRFRLADCDGWLDVYEDTLSNPLECAFYWSLSKNIWLGNDLFSSKYDLNQTLSEIDFLEGRKDYIHSYNGLGESSRDLIETKKDKDKRDSMLSELKIARDSLQKQIVEIKNEGESNLSLIRYCLDKGMKIDWNKSVSLIGGNDRDVSVNEISLSYYYDSIAVHKNYFKPQEEKDYDPFIELSSSLASYSTYPFLDVSLFKKIYLKITNKKNFFESIFYPWDDSYGSEDDEPIAYQAEKILFDLNPEEMGQYSGHTLLHTAIIHLDLPTVQKIIRNNKNELYVKTVPKQNFTSEVVYGKNALTPLELAQYRQKEIEKNLKESPDYLPYILCLEQIKEIVAFLRQELGMPTDNDNTSNQPPDRPKRYWSTLMDDDEI